MPVPHTDSGFQQSRNTGVICRVYPQGDDPVLTNAREVLDFSGRVNGPKADVSITAASTTKSMGSAAGSFSITVKAPSEMGRTKPSFLERVVDDDWLDLAFTVHGRPYHVMRGQIDNVREVRSTDEAGAGSRTYTITGRDFGAIFEKTPIWFNIYKDALAHTYALKLLESRGIAGSPDVAVRKLLYGFLEILTGLGRADWSLPPSMPNVAADFATQVVFISEDFDPTPARIAASMQLMDPTGSSLWGLVQEWSDPQFCELFCDLQPLSKAAPAEPVSRVIDDQVHPDASFDFEQTEMRVIFRTRPHPSQKMGTKSTWFKLPITEVPPQWVTTRDIGRGGMERYNAFFVSPQVVSTLNKANLSAPIWDLDSIRRHGMRPFYVESKYVASENNLVTMTQDQRNLVRDWHCLNPYLYNGSVALAGLFPGIRVGSRFRIAGERETQQETYYVEQATHNWMLASGGRTNLGLTRGWIGTENSYMTALDAMAARYVSAAE